MARPANRPRGLNFLLGGTVVAVVLLGASVLSGAVSFGLGAPDVRIDPPVTRDVPSWPALPVSARD